MKDSGEGRVGRPGRMSSKRGKVLEFGRVNQEVFVIEPFISGVEQQIISWGSCRQTRWPSHGSHAWSVAVRHSVQVPPGEHEHTSFPLLREVWFQIQLFPFQEVGKGAYLVKEDPKVMVPVGSRILGRPPPQRSQVGYGGAC